MFRHYLKGDWQNPSVDPLDAWDAPSTELGLQSEPAPAAGGGEPAAEAGAEKAAAGADEELADESADEPVEGEESDEDADVDPLELLTERDQDDQQQTRSIEDRYKALSKRARKLEKEIKRSLPMRSALREAGVDVRTLLNSHTQLTRLQAQIESNPRLRALIYDEGEPERGGRGEVEEEPVEYPFDVNDNVGRFMADFHGQTTRSNRDIAKRLDSIEKTLGSRLDRIETRDSQRERGAVMSTWRSAADAAAGKLDKNLQNMFRDAVLSAAEGRLAGRHNLTPQQVIDHYLKPLQISDKQKQRASDAAKQKTANRNAQLPRRPGGSGTPASPQAKRIPRLEDLNRRITREYGAGG